MERLTVLYDEQCAVCRRARNWILSQSTHVPLELLAAGSPAARARYAEVPLVGQELVVVDDAGQVWSGPDAFVMALWATKRYRPWSYRLSGQALGPVAEQFFTMVSKRRHGWSRFFNEEDEECEQCHN